MKFIKIGNKLYNAAQIINFDVKDDDAVKIIFSDGQTATIERSNLSEICDFCGIESFDARTKIKGTGGIGF